MAGIRRMQSVEDEKQLLLRLKDGDEQAFTALFYAYKDLLYSFLLGIVRSEAKADDLLQDVFLKLWKNRQYADNIESLNAYLYNMTKNVALDNLRRLSKEYAIMEDIQSLTVVNKEENLDPADILIGKEFDGRLKRAIEQLPQQQKKIFILRHQFGLKHEEIAKRLNLSVSTSKNAAKNAVDNLRKILKYTYLGLLLMQLIYTWITSKTDI